MIREAKNEDLQDILTLYQQLFPEEDYSRPESFTEVWSEIINDRKIACFIAYHGAKPASTCLITIIPNLTREKRPFAVIENVITHPDCRQMGYGRMTMETAIEYAKKRNCYKIILMSGMPRKGAHLFYERLGFDGNSKKGFQLRLP